MGENKYLMLYQKTSKLATILLRRYNYILQKNNKTLHHMADIVSFLNQIVYSKLFSAITSAISLHTLTLSPK